MGIRPLRRPSAPVPLTADEERFLRAFVRAVHAVPRILDAELQQQQGMSGTEYAVLMRLSEASDHRLRMSELATGCALSVSGMTRIVDRLEAGHLVVRRRCGDDRRGWHAVLTDAGLARLRQAWPTHLASVRRHVFDHLGQVDLGQFAVALEKFATEPATEPDTERASAAATDGCPAAAAVGI